MCERKLPRWSKEAKKALIDRDMNVKELSKEMQISREYVSKVINGTTYSPELANRISEFLGITDVAYSNII